MTVISDTRNMPHRQIGNSRYSHMTFGWGEHGRIHIFKDGPLCICLMPKEGLTNQSQGWPHQIHMSEICPSCDKMQKHIDREVGRRPTKAKAIKKAENKKIRDFQKRSKRQISKSRDELIPPDMWQRLRYEALKKSDGKCVLCGHGRREGVVLHVDHIKPVSKFPQFACDPNNLQVLCRSCNMGKSNRDSIDWRQDQALPS